MKTPCTVFLSIIVLIVLPVNCYAAPSEAPKYEYQPGGWTKEKIEKVKGEVDEYDATAVQTKRDLIREVNQLLSDWRSLPKSDLDKRISELKRKITESAANLKSQAKEKTIEQKRKNVEWNQYLLDHDGRGPDYSDFLKNKEGIQSDTEKKIKAVGDLKDTIPKSK